MSTMIEVPLLEAGAEVASSDVNEAAARLLKLLADPTRRRLFVALTEGETCNCELAEGLGLAQNLISHHIRQLREGGFVRERRDDVDARWIYYSLNAEALAEAWQSLDWLINPTRIRARMPNCPPPEAQS